MEMDRARPLTDERPAAFALAWMSLPDAASAAQGLLDRALDYCAEKMHLHSAQNALDLLREGNGMARCYAHHSLAEQVAEVLAGMDDTVQSVLVCDPDGAPEDLAFGEPAPTSPVHMVVRTRRKTQALYMLIGSIQDTLIEEYASRVGPGQLEYLLDVQVIDGEDVEKRRGYAGLLRSLHNRPIQVWHREQSQDAG